MCGCGWLGWGCTKRLRPSLLSAALRIVLRAGEARAASHSWPLSLLHASALMCVCSCAQVWSHPPARRPPPPLCSEGESMPPLRNDHKSALVSLAVNKSAFYWGLFIILHFLCALGLMLGEGAARNVNMVTMTEFSRSSPLPAAFWWGVAVTSLRSAPLWPTFSTTAAIDPGAAVKTPPEVSDCLRVWSLFTCFLFSNPATWLSASVPSQSISHHQLGLLLQGPLELHLFCNFWFSSAGFACRPRASP